MAQAMGKIKKIEQGREKFGTFVNPWNCFYKMVHTSVNGFTEKNSLRNFTQL